jgi:class 3 adenylate cyclase/tetratricopeptide (TPR) repeat protein
LTCSSCGAESRLGQKFCSSCGARLSATCPGCGSPFAPGAKFCGECGTALNGVGGSGAGATGAGVAPSTETTARDASGATSAPAAIAERRLVSVLFADLVGFTTIAEDRDPEQVRELLDGYFQTMREIVARYGGAVEKFIGDAVMAVWGAPTAHEDDAERAVRAALEMVEAVHGLGAASGIAELDLRAGVLTGEAAVTVGAEGQGMVAGDLVNTASRLQSVAAPGSVLVGQQTRDAASQGITFEPVGEESLKGKSAPVAAWRAVRVVAGVGGAGRYTGLEPPFEGRDEQLRLLKDLFHATVRERRARVVTIIGQAGTGKSRLVREFEKYSDGLVESIFWHVGRSPAYGEEITFWALGEMVRKRAGLAERDDEPTTRERIAATLEQFVPDEADRRWIEPRLLQLLGVGESRTGEREELFAAWRMFFERVAEHGPVVMAFEDLENADPGLLDFIDYVVEWSRIQPIFILAMTRPELLERRPNWGAGQRAYAAIGLEPLTDTAMRQALAGLVPGLPDAAVRAILSRAEGVPLYAVETVRMLINEGRLTERDGVYQPVGDLPELEIPNTLHALIAARLDALDADERAIVQDCAVLGHSFTLAALAGISGRPAEELEPALRALTRREVLQVDADPRSPERGQYAFVQGLLREVAYSTLSKKDRRKRHLAAARYFESLGDEELAGALARHYLDAWRASPEGPEADAIAAQARVALRAAAERAAALHSHAQALTFLERLLSVTTDEQEKAGTLERAALAAEAAARFDTADSYGREAMDIHRANGDLSGVARAAVIVGRGRLSGSRLTEGIELVENVLAEVGDRDDDPAAVELISVLARLKSLQTEDDVAIKLAERALIAAERLDLVDVIANTVMTRAVSLAYLRRTREALILMPGVLQMAETHGLVVLELRARLNISQMIMIDYPAAGLPVARVGLEKAQKLGLRLWEELLAGNVTMAALRTGDWDGALDLASSTIAEGSSNERSAELPAESIGYVAVMKGLRGDGGAALREALIQVDSVLTQTEDPQFPDMAQVLRAWGGLIEGDFDAPYQHVMPHQFADPTYTSAAYVLAGHAMLWQGDAERARLVADRFRGFNLRGKWVNACRTVLDAGIAALEGRNLEARSGFRDAIGTLRDEGVLLDVLLSLIDEVATLGVTEPAGQAAAAEARQLAERLGAVVLLEQLERSVEGAESGVAAVPSRG